MRYLALTVALALLLCLTLSGCGWLWPRDNPRDPARCDPACPRGLVCHEGICKLGDGGLPPDLGADGGATAPDMTRQDQASPDAAAR